MCTALEIYIFYESFTFAIFCLAMFYYYKYRYFVFNFFSNLLKIQIAFVLKLNCISRIKLVNDFFSFLK